MNTEEYQYQKKMVEAKRKDERVAERLNEYWAQVYVLGKKLHNGTRTRVIIKGSPLRMCLTIKAETKKQAMRIFEELESESHEFIEWW